MSSPQQFSLRWNNYLRHITLAFDSLRSQEDLVDVTLSCEGRKIRAHKVLLSACSSYFREIFKENPCQHPVIIFKNVKYEDLSAIIEFMYQGEVNVVQESLPSFLNTAELLSVQGLTENSSKEDLFVNDSIAQTLHTKTASSFNSTKVLPVSFEPSNTYEAKIPSTSETSDYMENSTPQKKSKLTRSSHTTDIYKGTSTDNAQNENDLEFIHTDMKIEIPEFIDLPESSNAQIQTNDDVSEIMNDESFENSIQDHDKDQDKYKSDMETNLQNQEMTTLEMDSVEMRRIFSNQTSVDLSRVQDNPDSRTCHICIRQFTTLSTLKRHMESRHIKRKCVYSCTICLTKFKTKWSLSTHNSRFHRSLLRKF